MIDPREEARLSCSTLCPWCPGKYLAKSTGHRQPRAFRNSHSADLEIQPPGKMMITSRSFPICRLGPHECSLSQGQVASSLNMSHILPSDSPHLGKQSPPPPSSSSHPHPCLPWGAFDQRMKRYDQNTVPVSRKLKQDACHRPPPHA